MKKLCLLLLLSISILPLNAQEETGKIYFLRLTGTENWLSGYKAIIDGETVCKLNHNRYSVHEVSPGEHTVAVQIRGEKSRSQPITVNIESGKTYYINMMYESGLVSNLHCQEVTEGSANIILPKLKLDNECLAISN